MIGTIARIYYGMKLGEKLEEFREIRALNSFPGALEYTGNIGSQTSEFARTSGLELEYAIRDEVEHLISKFKSWRRR
ncbi:hypothetical protein CO038_04210 [Candidatus Pacearchaeota archaeon CG_4_9_14_0_2_um_filter_39_13]|nr:MAG: hypothetical protein AUJ64_00565 [Candidatus Pacearchaeota archaeon CG1_02_39_14]PJC44388.1 MAG: hypothetical protein CO038_04210 [Candidatus Pacearchaeota archaeon CG_4_9_14_0_2_um_filter_39_13]